MVVELAVIDVERCVPERSWTSSAFTLKSVGNAHTRYQRCAHSEELMLNLSKWERDGQHNEGGEMRKHHLDRRPLNPLRGRRA